VLLCNTAYRVIQENLVTLEVHDQYTTTGYVQSVECKIFADATNALNAMDQKQTWKEKDTTKLALIQRTLYFLED
jgi:hypothetical protein